jgi:hypothetical protein
VLLFFIIRFPVFINIPDNTEGPVKEKEDSENDFYFFGKIAESWIKKKPETKKNKQGGYSDA